MRSNRNAVIRPMMVALVLAMSGQGFAQVSDPARLTLEEAGLVSEDRDVSTPIALQSSSSIAPPVPEPVGNGVGLSDLLNLALAQSPKLSVQRAKVGQSQMSALATGLFPNPVVEGGGKNVGGGDSGLVFGVNQELPINGSRKMERQAATLRHSAERAALEREIQVVFSEIESAYVDVLAAQRLVEVNRRGLEIASDSLRLVSDSYQAGLASSLPLSLALSEQANALKTLRLSEKQVQVTRSTLAGLIALDEPSLAPIFGRLDDSLLQPGMGEIGSNRPDLSAADLRVQAAESEIQANRRRMIPNPTLGYQREEGEDTENFFTIGMEIPIFNSGRLKVQESMASQQVVSREKSALARTIQTEVQTGSVRLDSAREAVTIYETEIRPSIAQSLESARGAFQSGTTDMSLLLQTQRQLIENERDYIRAIHELRSAEVAYKLAIGVRKESVQ